MNPNDTFSIGTLTRHQIANMLNTYCEEQYEVEDQRLTDAVCTRFAAQYGTTLQGIVAGDYGEDACDAEGEFVTNFEENNLG